MFTKQIALVSLTNQISAADLSLTAAALQKQATRDLGPIWNVEATVDAFMSFEEIPYGYWPIYISDEIDANAEGYHWDDANNIPYARVRYDDSWQLTCSHEMCEMLVDPYGNKTQTADSIVNGQGRVSYLVEVCDPCEDAGFAYPVNGILLSDFYTPNYFDPVQNSAVRYSYTGAITKPKEILRNGYLSWFDPISATWFQAIYFGSAVRVINLSRKMASSGQPIRARVDRVTNDPNKETSFTKTRDNHVKNNPAFELSAQAYRANLMKSIL